MVLVPGRRNVGWVARTNLFEVVFRVSYGAPHVKSSENCAAPLPWDDSQAQADFSTTGRVSANAERCTCGKI